MRQTQRPSGRHRTSLIIVVALAIQALAFTVGASTPGPLPGPLPDPLDVRFNGLRLSGSPAGVFLLPEEPFLISAGRPLTPTFDGVWQTQAPGELRFTAPATPGPFRIDLVAGEDTAPFTLNGFVMHPFDQLQAGRLHGYRVGDYPGRPLQNNLNYLPPQGFVQVTEGNRHLRVSRNFTLGEFTSKQSTAFPKYVTLRPELLVKLELIKAAVERATGATQRMVVMSGYRTPYYNRAIGNVQYSRHVYGDAADIYLDARPRDGVMDDLNGDGRTTKDDARWLYQLIEELAAAGEFDGLNGGLGLYGANAAHGPFVHVDVRGHRARWGT